MTRKSKARYGMNRTYKLNPAVKALRNALFAGMAMAVVAPGAQAVPVGGCIEDGFNTITCSGFFGGTLNLGPGDVTLPFDPTTVILDNTTIVNVGGSAFGVNVFSFNDLTLISDGVIDVINRYVAIGLAGFTIDFDSSVTNNGSINAVSYEYGTAIGVYASSIKGDSSANNTGYINAASSSNAVGMASISQSGDAYASNDGTINVYSWGATADVYSWDAAATGIFASAQYGNVTVNNAGSVIVDASINANGINAYSITGAVIVDNSGYIRATSNNSTAMGVRVRSNGGDVSVYNSGDIVVTSNNSNAYGVYATSFDGDVSFGSSVGSIRVNASYGNATGIFAESYFGNIGIVSSSDIYAYAENGNATGIFAESYYGNIGITNNGDLLVSANSGRAIGVNVVTIEGEVYVGNSGDLNISSVYGSATGINAVTTWDDVVVYNSGNLTVSAKYDATGIDASANYDVTVGNLGNISATSQNSTAIGINAVSQNGDVYVGNEGDIYATGGIRANAINAFANYGDVTVFSSGDLTVSADDNYNVAIGIFANSIRGAAASVVNTGNISATSQNGTAFGINAGSFGDVYVGNEGDIYATGVKAFAINAFASSGDSTVFSSGDLTVSAQYATGINANAGDDVTVVNLGNISATSQSRPANGIKAVSQNGDVYVGNEGDIYATGYGSAFAIDAFANNYGDITVFSSGDLTVSADRTAIGISAESNASVTVGNLGNISATSQLSNAIGIRAVSQYADVYVGNGGDMLVSSVNSNAMGIEASAYGYGDVYVVNEGDFNITSVYGSATGINAETTYGDVVVHNSGDLTVSAKYSATGINATGNNGYATVINTGDLNVFSYSGNAKGISARSNYSDVYIYSNGNIDVSSTGLARGIEAYARNDINIINIGDINASSYNGAARGIAARSYYGDINVYNSGDIDASSTWSTARGVSAVSRYDIDIINTGDLSVSSVYSQVRGISAYSIYGDIFVYSSGDIDANSDRSFAEGININARNGYANVVNLGAITAYGLTLAHGISAESRYDVSVTNGIDANIVASSTNGHVEGIWVDSFTGSASVTNQASISASSVYSDAQGIDANAQYDVYVGNSGDINASSTNSFAVGILVDSDFGYAEVINLGDITAYGYSEAHGIYVSATYDVDVINGGDLNISSYVGASSYVVVTSGISADSEQGDSFVYNAGAIDVSSSNGYSQGILAIASNGDVGVYNTGNITVSAGYNSAVGIKASSNWGDVSVYNGGDISTYSENSRSTGIRINAPNSGQAIVMNNGNIDASSLYGEAIGIAAFSGWSDISIYSMGDISAYSEESGARGISANSWAGDIYIETGGLIETTGSWSSTGVYARTGSTYQNYTQYNGDISVYADNTSDIQATATSIYGSAFGMDLNAQNGSVNVINAGDILATSNNYSVGIYTESAGSTSITNSGSIDAAGGDPWAIVTYADAGTTITNTTSGKIFGAIWTQANDFTNDSLTNSGKWYVGNDNGTYFGAGNDSITNNVSGKIYMDDSYISMGYSEGSVNSFLNNGKLYANNDNYIDMGGNGSVFTNNGNSIHMDDGDVNDSLTIYGNFAGTGGIYVDADGVSMLADRLYIEGNVVSNTANTINVSMLTMPTLANMLSGETIDIVHVSGISTAANFNIGIVTFPMDELYTVGAGLIKDINYSGSNDLFSLGFEITGLGEAGILASGISPAVQNMWNQSTGTLFQREGTHREFNQNPNGGGAAMYESSVGLWVRGFSSSGSVSPDASHSNFGSGGSSNFDQDLDGLEVGLGITFNSQWAGGVLGGTADSTLKLENGGRTKIDGSTVGAYVTYTPGNGFYADLSYRSMDFDGNSTGAQTQFGFSGQAKGYSLEMGYGYKMASGLIIEPQLQYSAMDVDLYNIGYNNADFQLQDGSSSLLRVGAAIRKSYKTAGGNYWTPYAAASYLDELEGNNSYLIGGLLEGNVDTSGGSALLEAGVTGFIGKFGVSGGVNWRDGGAYDSVFGGQVSLRYDW